MQSYLIEAHKVLVLEDSIAMSTFLHSSVPLGLF